MNRIAASIMIACMFAVALVVPVLAHDGCIEIGPVPGGLVLWCPAQVEPTPTSTPETTATATPLPPTPAATATATEHVHPTAAPTNTPVPGATPIAQYPTAPKCPPEAHDPMRWHAVWNSTLGCYFDHSHGDDPASADDLFGPLDAFLGTGGNLIPAWHQDFEHTGGAGHGGWKVEVNRNLPASGTIGGGSTDKVEATRCLVHHGPKGFTRSEHTFWCQVLVRHPDGTVTKTGTGGVWMLGFGMSPYKVQAIPTDKPLDTWAQWQLVNGYSYAKNAPDSSDPYRAHVSCAQYDHVLQWEEIYNKARELRLDVFFAQRFWIMDDDNPGPTGGRLYGQNPFIELAVTVGDSSSCVEGDVNGLKREPFVHEYAPAKCPLLPNGALGCRLNNSWGPQLFSIEIDAGARTAWLDNSQWDADKRPGWLDINTYMRPVLRNPNGSLIVGRPAPQRFLTEAASCTGVTPECVPFIHKGRTSYAYWETPNAAGPWKTVNYDAGYVNAADGRTSTLLPGFGNVYWLGPGN